MQDKDIKRCGNRALNLLFAFLFILVSGVLPAFAQTRDLTMVVLVNSANTVGYKVSTTSPGEYQRYPERYLEHLQIPYRVIDVSTTTTPPDLSTTQLILAGHRGLSLSTAWQNAVLNAVQAGTGFVNLDSDPAIGNSTHIRTIFGATSSSVGTPATTITVPLAVMQGGSTPHYITKLQMKLPSDPAGDLVYTFHADDNDVTGTATATILNGSNATVLAKIGSDPLLMVTAYGSGRAVYFSTYDYLKSDRFGFMMGADDLFWRSIVWAARKPFVLRGYPRFMAVQQDDPVAGWASRVTDLYNTTYTGTTASDGTGGPWKVTGFIQEVNLDPGSADRASVISDITAGKLHVAMHTNTGGSGGDLYWTGENSNPLTDSQWLSNLNNVLNWVKGNGGTDTIPLSASLVPHFWDLSNNTGNDLWNKLGVRYLTEIQKPGVYYSSTKTNTDRLALRPFRIYDLPPTYGNPAERWPIYYADDITVGSRSGLPSQTFFSFCTQLLGYTYPTFDASWPQDQAGISSAKSLENWQAYTWRFWSSMAPVQIYTHDGGNMEHSTDTERRGLVSSLSQWMAPRGVRHIFMSDLGAYMRARTKSVLSTASASTSTITLNFTGAALDADGSPVSTKAYIFYGDDEGSLLNVSGFSNGTTATFPNQTPPMLVVNKASLTFNALPGGANPSSQTFTISNGGTGTMTWTVAKSASWLTVTPTSGTNSGTVTVGANISGLAAGTYTGTVTVTAGNGATNSPQIINVTLYLNNPQLSVTPTSIAFTGFQGQGNPGATSVAVSNTGGGTLAWSATSDAGWLTVSPTSGNAPSTIAVQPNISGLAIGNYTGHVTINAPGAQNSPTVVTVSLSVSGVLMSSNFSDGTLNGWVASPLGRFTNWSVSSGVLNYNGGGAAQLYAGNAAWTDYDLQAQIAFTTLSDYPGGIRGRVNPTTGASYALWFYPAEKTVKLYRVGQWNIDSGFTTLGVAGLVSIDTGTMHTVKMSFSGPSITVFYDGTQLLTASDSTYTSGLVAFDVSNQAVRFDNVLVSGNSGAQPALTGPASMNFTAISGSAPPAPQTLSLGSSTGALSFSAGSDSSWLSVGTTQGMTPASITTTVSGAGMSAGTYLGHVLITSPAASNNPLSVPVNFSLQSSPTTIALSASTVSFTATQGQSAPAPQPVTITNAGGGAMNWTATANAPWIQVSPGSGSAPGAVSIGVSQAGLANGSYSSSVTIAASGAVNTPQTITVNMNVVSQDLNETFTSGANGWVISPMGNAGGWSATGGAYTYSGAGLSQSCAGNTGWTDYSFITTVKLSNLNNYPGGIRGRVNTSGAGYSLWLYPGNSLMKMFRTAGWNIDGSGTALLSTVGQSFDTGTHTLRMDFQGTAIYVYWDGALTMQATDSQLTGGFVCLEGASAPITFDNVQVLGPIANPQLAASPNALSFATQAGSTAAAQTVQLSSGTSGMVFSASSSASWLTVASSGMSSPATLTVTASAASLTTGSYTANVIVTSPGAPNSPLTIPVTFSVGSASMVLSPTTINLVGSTTLNPGSVPIAVSNGGTGSLTWSASPTVSWLTPTPTTGTAPSSTSVTVASNTLAVGNYTGAVTFSSGQAANSPVSTTFNLRVGNLLFSDDFSSGAGNWTVSPLGSPANWSVSAAGYTFDGGAPSQSYAGSTSWTDYTFSTDVKLASLSNYPGGVRVRVDPSSGAGYAIWLYPGSGVIKIFRTLGWNIDGSGTTLLAQSGTVSFDSTAAHNLRVDVQGPNLSVYYDNVLAVSTSDATYATGVVAIDGSNQPVTYDNVRVVSY